MRKVLFTVALLLTACFVSAQVSVVKEAKSLKSKPEEAAKAIEPALTNPETANDPETWKLAGDFQKAIYDEENMKLYLPGGQADTTKLYNSLAKMYDFYLKCDEIEQAKVQSGELKKPKFRKKNADALKTLRLNLVNGGGDAYNKGDYADALKYFGLFVDVVNEPMFADDDELKADTLNALYACYATLAANMLKDNQAVIKYGNIGKNHKEEGYRALMCLAETYGQKEGGDSAKWLEVIKEGTELFPKQEYFVGNIMDYYIQKGMVDEGLAQINKLLATSETPYYLYVKEDCFVVKSPEGEVYELPFDHGFVCLGMRAQSKVYEEVSKAYKDTNVRVENIGDSVRARRIIDGTFEGRNIIFTLEQKGFL